MILTHPTMKIQSSQRFDGASRRQTQIGRHASREVLSMRVTDGYPLESAFEMDRPVTCGTHKKGRGSKGGLLAKNKVVRGGVQARVGGDEKRGHEVCAPVVAW